MNINMNNKKLLSEISWNVSEKEYRIDKAYSYSTLAKFYREGFSKIDTLFDKVESPSLAFGSIVDTLITGSEEEFSERYVVSEFPEISSTLINIVKDVFREFNLTHRTLESIPDSEIIMRADLHDYQKNWRPETRARVIKEKGSQYYQLLYLSIDKTIISQKDYNDAISCVDSLKDSKSTEKYFSPDNPFDDIERYYQLKFKGEYVEIPIRCMADLLYVDHKRKIIIPCDLKTTSKKEWEFHKSFIEWCYWIQAQLYWYIIRQNLDKDDIYKSYKLANYRFIVINRFNKKPLVWEYKDTQVIIDCFYGKNKQYECKNWRNILKDLHYYLSNKPEYPIGIDDDNENCIDNWLNRE